VIATLWQPTLFSAKDIPLPLTVSAMMIAGLPLQCLAGQARQDLLHVMAIDLNDIPAE